MKEEKKIMRGTRYGSVGRREKRIEGEEKRKKRKKGKQGLGRRRESIREKEKTYDPFVSV